jgi:hypothetical protein
VLELESSSLAFLHCSLTPPPSPDVARALRGNPACTAKHVVQYAGTRPSCQTTLCSGVRFTCALAVGPALKAYLSRTAHLPYSAASVLEGGWLPKHIGRQCGSSGGIPTHPAPTKWSQAAGRVGGRDKPHERRTCGRGALGPIAATLEPTTLAAVELWPGWSLAHGEFVCRQSCGIGGASVTASARWPSSLRSRNCPTRPSWCQPTLAGWCRCDQ